MTQARDFFLEVGYSEYEAEEMELWARNVGILAVEIVENGYIDVYRIPSPHARGMYFVCLETHFLCDNMNITAQEFFEFYARYGLGLPHPN